MTRILLCTGLLLTMISCGAVWMTGTDWTPAALTEFQVQASNEKIALSWTGSNGFIGTLIRYSTKDMPTSPSDGYPVPNGNDGRFTASPGLIDSFAHTGLSNGTIYYYAAFAYDEVSNYSEAATGNDTPGDEVAPTSLISFSAHGGESMVILHWVQGADEDVAGTLIRYSTESFPVSPTGGSAVPNGSNGIFSGSPASADSFSHTDLTNGTVYYYSAFAYDEVLNYSIAAIDSAPTEDLTPPTLTIGILQDPCFTSSLDVYLLASEKLHSGSVKLSAGGSPVPMNLIDSEKNLWGGNYTLTRSGMVSLTASADDLAGYTGSANLSFAAKLLLARQGGSAVSPDGILEILFKPGALEESTYVIIQAAGQSVPFGKTLLTESNRLSYIVSPQGLLWGEEAIIAIRYTSLNLSGAAPDRLYIRDDELGMPLRLHVDPERGIASINVTHLGGISLALGDARSSAVIDPSSVVLEQNQPNPFNPITTICFEIGAPQKVRLDVFGISGKRMCTLVDRHLSAGGHSITWDGTNEKGATLASGVYFYQLQTSQNTITRKMLLLR